MENKTVQFIIPIGISGSGKTRWIKELNLFYNGAFKVISPDEIRKELTGDISNQTHNKKVFEIAIDRTINSLNEGNPVIFDATNIKSKDRKNMLDKIKSDVTNRVIPIAKVFHVTPGEAKLRVCSDITMGVDRSIVYSDVIDRQYKTYINDLDKINNDGYDYFC